MVTTHHLLCVYTCKHYCCVRFSRLPVQLCPAVDELPAHSWPYFSPCLQVKAVLHAADISNPIRPFPAALSSAQRVHSEFQRQVAHERQLELPVAPHMDATDPAVWAEMELQFIDYVVGPLWGRLGQVHGEHLAAR